MKWWRAILISIAALHTCAAQNVLLDIIHSDSLQLKYSKVFKNPARYHFQVIYTEINRDSNNRAHLKRHYLYKPSTNYYYPASLVKLPLVALALEKVDSLNKLYSITKDTRLCVDSAHQCETTELYDSTSQNRYPSIAQYIRRMLLVSDNYAYNRIYEFLTPAYINRRLHQLGYKNAIVNQRFNPNCDSTNNRFTNPFTFLAPDSTVMYRQPADSNMCPITNVARHTVVGKGYADNNKIKPARDFRRNNYIPFKNENDILLSLIFPNAFPASSRFRLTADDYMFLYKYMGMLPRESDYPRYDRKMYPDNLKKYNYFGTTDTISDSNTVRSLNIVGRAYGFLADCSYIIDTSAHVEFCLSVLMYLNEKDVINSGKYEYNDVGLPFMSDLGKAIMKYEKKRKRKYKPDLNKFNGLWGSRK
ncbi:MAG: serine hydrolase [Bacteroidia bacterium]